MKGHFITFEGGDGAGKSTLIEHLFSTLQDRGSPVIKTRAPGGTHAGQMIRHLLLNAGEPLVSRCELLLFLADRAQQVETIILPALQEGKIVLCDRYNDSTIAYQGVARGLNLDAVEQICHFATTNLEPDLTLYLDLDPEVGLQRLKLAKGGKDRIEAEDLNFHQKIRDAFLAIARAHPQRFHSIDASLSKEIVLKNALRLIDEYCFSTKNK